MKKTKPDFIHFSHGYVVQQKGDRVLFMQSGGSFIKTKTLTDLLQGVLLSFLLNQRK